MYQLTVTLITVWLMEIRINVSDEYSFMSRPFRFWRKMKEERVPNPEGKMENS